MARVARHCPRNLNVCLCQLHSKKGHHLVRSGIPGCPQRLVRIAVAIITFQQKPSSFPRNPSRGPALENAFGGIVRKKRNSRLLIASGTVIAASLAASYLLIGKKDSGAV